MSVTAADSPSTSDSSFQQSIHHAQSAVQSLSLILGPLSFSENPALSLLHDPSVAASISCRLRHPNSGTGDDPLCRWLYDTFQSTDPSLQLAVLRFFPAVAALYLSRTASRHQPPLAGFEAVLLALYAHETVARAGDPLTVSLPNLSNPSLYHEAKLPSKNNNKSADEPAAIATAVISPVLEPHGTVRSTKRARIVGVALDLYYSKISLMPIESKLEFCQFAARWAGGGDPAEDESGEEKGGRIPLPWELLQPVLRIVGHCLMGPSGGGEELKAAAIAAVRRLHERAVHDMNTQAVLATRSLLRLGMMAADTIVEAPILSSATSEISESDAGKFTL